MLKMLTGKNALIKILFLLTVSSTLFSCGGAGDQFAGGGIGGTGIYAGVITNFGSIEINEETLFNTSVAEFKVDGESASQGNLELGMKVEIEASDGIALTVDFESEVKGPVDDIPSATTLIVMGQTVKVNNSTKYKGVADLTGLHIDDLVIVSGYFTGDDEILATFVELNAGLTEFKVKGEVDDLNPFTQTFEINGLVVDYSGVLGLPPFNEGDFVEVKGTNLDSVNKILEATELELETYLPPAIPGYHMEIEGIITQVTSPSDFEVNGQRVFTDGATVFENGTSVDIAINVRVEVEGTVDENSILIANEVEFKYE